MENEDFILKVEHRDFTVFLKATVEVLKRHLRELQQIKRKKENVSRVNWGRNPNCTLSPPACVIAEMGG